MNPPITNTAVNGLPARPAGVASAMATTSRQIGNTLGVAVLASFATRHAHGPGPADLRACWAIALAAALAITALAISTPAQHDHEKDRRTPSKVSQGAGTSTAADA